MDALLELESKEQSIKETRIDTAIYFKNNNKFEHQTVSLMEISFTFNVMQNTSNEDNILSTHNRLLQTMYKQDLPYIKSEIQNPPYFKPTPRWEFWVSNESAMELIIWLKKTYFPDTENYEPYFSSKRMGIALVKVDSDLIPLLKINLIDVIKEINPGYKGKIHDKTSLPHRLILRIIAILIKLNKPINEITWPSICAFIEKNIYNNQELKSLTDLDEINEDEIIVAGITIPKRYCQNCISLYKSKVFDLHRKLKKSHTHD